MHINGNLTSNQGSETQIEFNSQGTNPGINNDLLVVHGNANLNGGTVQIIAAPGSYSAKTKYTFLTYTGTRTGEFDGIVDNLPLMTAELLYANGSVQFELFRNSTDYAALARTFNQFQVATYLDTINPSATGDLAFVLDQLNLQTAAGARSAFQQMTGEVNGTMAQLGVQNTTQIYLMLQRQLHPQRTTSDGIAPLPAVDSSSSENPKIVDTNYNLSTKQIEFVDCESSCSQWTGWISGYGLGGDAQSDGNSASGTYGIGGTVFGLQRQLDCGHSLGFFGAYSGLDLTITNPNQSSKANDCQFGNYLRGDNGFNYYLLAGSVGFDDYKTSRLIDFGSVDRVASGNTGGWQASVWLEDGLESHCGNWDIQPFMALQYIYLRQGSLTETNADSLNLQVGGIDTNALRSVLGASTSLPIRLANGQLSLESRTLWLHEFLEPDTSLNSTFADTGGGSFITRGLNFGRDWAVVGGGLKWQVNPRLQLLADYDLQANTVQVFHVGSAALNLMW